MTETPASVRAAVESAKVALIGLQHDSVLGATSAHLSVEMMDHLDRAWFAAVKLQRARESGQ